MATDFGPVPASQVKSESNRIFEALEQRRRVLISRYGKVVAVIEPPSADRHAHMLLAFAVPSHEAPLELSATDIAKGAPGEHIRRAEQGTAALVTRNNKVLGVLLPYSGEPVEPDPDEVELRLARFEETHPEATPGEFAAEVARLNAREAVEVQNVGWVEALRPDLSSAGDDLADTRLWTDATLIQAMALEQTGQVGPATLSLLRLIRQLGGQKDLVLRRRVHAAQVELARLYVSTGEPDAALRLAAEVLGELKPGSAATLNPGTIPVQPSNYEHA